MIEAEIKAAVGLWRTAPRTPAIYFLVRRKELVYIGQSHCLTKRFAHHECIGTGRARKAYYIRLPTLPKYKGADRATREGIERVMIARFRPPWNGFPRGVNVGDLNNFNRHVGEDVLQCLISRMVADGIAFTDRGSVLEFSVLPTESIQARVEPALYKALEELAKRTRRTKNAELVLALEEHLRRNQLWPPAP